jgi:ankyrin repeat protein
VVALLLETGGIDLDYQDKNGQTPLSLAAANGYKTVISQLLAKDGINLNCKDKTA